MVTDSTLVLYSFAESEWNSCKKIVSNLAAAYGLALEDNNLQFMDFSRLHAEGELIVLAEEILRQAPKQIVFIDHQPHPANLLALLLPRISTETVIWTLIYGDSILPNPAEWLRLEPLLKKFKLGFICASHRQQQFINQFLKDTRFNFVCPFPMEPAAYTFKPEVRQSTRAMYQIDKEFVWLYTGRLSQQKNIQMLIRSFGKYKQRTGATDKLILAGSFDTNGIPYLGLNYLDHQYFHLCLDELNLLKPEIANSIIWTGLLNEEGLSRVYNAADVFVSLSTHNDEDYGMSCAEALMAGLPCVLTDWGGYGAFKSYISEGVHLVPVKFMDYKLGYDERAFWKGINYFKQGQLSRQDLSISGEARFSVKAVAEIVRGILQKKPEQFKGFEKNFEQLVNRWKQGQAFGNSEIGFNHFYKKLYEPYYL